MHAQFAPPAQTTLQAAASGESEALRQLYDAFAPALHATAHRLFGNAGDAQDLVQEVFVALVSRPERLSELLDPRAYLFSMLHHAAFRRAAKSKREQILQLAAPPIDLTHPHPDLELRRAVTRLPLEQREVLALKIDAGFTFDEIARLTGASLNTAASRYRYALAALRSALLPETGEQP